MANKAKKTTVRSFKITNTQLSENSSGLLSMLKNILTPDSTIEARKMKLSEEEPDEDVMAYYKWSNNGSLLFGTMMCIMPATAGGVLTPELLNKNTLTQDDVINGENNQWQIKDHFFFLTDDQYLVVSLPSSRSIERFQTYLNYLLEDIRNSIIEIQPVLVTASDLGVKRIKSIVIGNQTISATPELNKISTWLKNVPKELVQSILKQQDSLDEIDLDQLISAELVIKIKNKSKKGAIKDSEKIIGAFLKPTTTNSGVVINTDKGQFKGHDVQHKETLDIQMTDSGNIIYESMKLKMEQVLQSIKNRKL